jgi:hypothetical protein
MMYMMGLYWHRHGYWPLHLNWYRYRYVVDVVDVSSLHRSNMGNGLVVNVIGLGFNRKGFQLVAELINLAIKSTDSVETIK